MDVRLIIQLMRKFIILLVSAFALFTYAIIACFALIMTTYTILLRRWSENPSDYYNRKKMDFYLKYRRNCIARIKTQ